MKYTLYAENIDALSLEYPAILQLPQLDEYFSRNDYWKNISDVTERMPHTYNYLAHSEDTSKDLLIMYHCGGLFDDFDKNFDFGKFGEASRHDLSRERYYFAATPILNYCKYAFSNGCPAALYRVVVERGDPNVESFPSETRVYDASSIRILDRVEVSLDEMAKAESELHGISLEEAYRLYESAQQRPSIRKGLLTHLVDTILGDYDWWSLERLVEGEHVYFFGGYAGEQTVAWNLKRDLNEIIHFIPKFEDMSYQPIFDEIDMYILGRGGPPDEGDLDHVYRIIADIPPKVGLAVEESGLIPIIKDLYEDYDWDYVFADSDQESEAKGKKIRGYARSLAWHIYESWPSDVAVFKKGHRHIANEFAQVKPLIRQLWLEYPIWSVQGFIRAYTDLFSEVRPIVTTDTGGWKATKAFKNYPLGDPCEVPMFMLRISQIKDHLRELNAHRPEVAKLFEGEKKEKEVYRELQNWLYSIIDVLWISERVPNIEISIRVIEASAGIPEWFCGFRKVTPELKQFMLEMCSSTR